MIANYETNPRQQLCNYDLALCQLFSTADNLSKKFGPRLVLTKCLARSGSKLYDNLMVFLKAFFVKLLLKKNQKTTKKQTKLPSRQRVNSPLYFIE